ncbi:MULTISPECIES: tRNA (guanosine(37)-N1)-methyltransferase TrmD [unclassified Paenibacillus]|uniref:tRNA (guanosine(37)-N1)-methyltransferase TrmD n=1 Tax=unclassified Paenibacillus TaxID=185978 RepID=UPI002F3EE55C
MKIDVLTLFPEMFDGVFNASILGKARDKGIVSLQAVNFRNYSKNKHQTVDDYPYGGGGGMVLQAEPVFEAVEALIKANEPAGKPRVILMCPQGQPYSQKKAEELAKEEHLILICGHYEGYDERIREHLVTDELSVGDYVLTGGELPAMTIIDSVVRLLPGTLGNASSAVTDSYSTGLLEYPHYTRPAVFRDWSVPDVLVSGHHANVEIWRREQSLLRTLRRRPDMLSAAELTDKERQWLKKIAEEEQIKINV